MYGNRKEAGEILAPHLDKFKNEQGIVLAVPRGGVVVAEPICERLQWPMDIIIPRKVPVPGNPEVAMGAVTEDGTVMLDDHLLGMVDIDEELVCRNVNMALEEVKERQQRYRGDRPLPELQGKTVIVVDDGIATGYTLKAALQTLREKNVQKLFLAVPVAPQDTVTEFERLVDQLICPLTPRDFRAVGQFYEDFDQTTESEVKDILSKYF